MDDLVKEIIKISGIELVTKSRKDGTTWKEYDVKVEDHVKGTHYSIPLKKKDGEETAAYGTFKAKRVEWEELFIDDKSIEIGVACSIKKNDWTHEGESGTSIYKTIRFFKEADEFRNQISKEEVLQVDDKKEEEIDIEKINF